MAAKNNGRFDVPPWRRPYGINAIILKIDIVRTLRRRQRQQTPKRTKNKIHLLRGPRSARKEKTRIAAFQHVMSRCASMCTPHRFACPERERERGGRDRHTRRNV
jgi:hypothetical protein